MSTNVKLTVGGAIVAAVLLAASFGTALAADPAPTPGTGPRGPVAGAVGAVCQGIGNGFSSVAQALQKLAGLAPEEFVAERQAGKSAVQIASDNNVSEDALTDEVLSARKASLDEAVKAGRITQERADFMLENMTERVGDRLNDATVGPRGPRGGNGPAAAGRIQSGFGERGQGAGTGMMNRAGGRAPVQ